MSALIRGMSVLAFGSVVAFGADVSAAWLGASHGLALGIAVCCFPVACWRAYAAIHDVRQRVRP